MFSTTTGWPSSSASFAATGREKESVGPPGGNGTIHLSGLAGYWPKARVEKNRAITAHRLRIDPPELRIASTMSTRCKLVDLELGLGDELRPARKILAHLLLQSRRAGVGRLRALLEELVAQRRGKQGPACRRSQLLQHRSRNERRCIQCIPGIGLVVGHARLRDGG